LSIHTGRGENEIEQGGLPLPILTLQCKSLHPVVVVVVVVAAAVVVVRVGKSSQ